MVWIVDKKWSIENWQLQLKHAFWFQKFIVYKNTLDIETNVISQISKILHTWQLIVACFPSKLTLTSKKNWILVLKNEKQMSNLEKKIVPWNYALYKNELQLIWKWCNSHNWENEIAFKKWDCIWYVFTISRKKVKYPITKRCNHLWATIMMSSNI